MRSLRSLVSYCCSCGLRSSLCGVCCLLFLVVPEVGRCCCVLLYVLRIVRWCCSLALFMLLLIVVDIVIAWSCFASHWLALVVDVVVWSIVGVWCLLCVGCLI